MYVVAPMPIPANAEGDERRRRERREAPVRVDEPERGGRDDERGRVEQSAEERPAASPSATSVGPSGVASIASYVFAYFSFQKTFVASYTAPFIAEEASSAGAT